MADKEAQEVGASDGLFCPLNTLSVTPIKQNVLKVWLNQYPDQVTAEFIKQGFREGFKIEYQGLREEREAKNHKSAINNPEIVSKKLEKEVKLGRVAGPFNVKPISNLTISPIGLVEKSTPGEYRLIFDLSFPRSKSINDGIPSELTSVTYTNFDSLTELVQRLGCGSHLVKLDIQSAFRLIPLHPDDFSLMGMCHKGDYYVDKALPFGCAISCALFEKFSCFLEWCAKECSSSQNLVHYLDDFCGAEVTYENAKVLLQSILDLFESLGVPIAQEKVEGPATCLKFLGLEVDTVAMEVRLPTDKINGLLSVINDVLNNKSKITLKELQSLLGKLNFACRAVVPGRAFSRRLIDATCHAKQPHHRIRITAAMRDDLGVWKEFLQDFNGRSLMLSKAWVDSEALALYTDAAANSGYGAFFEGHWVSGSWPNNWLLQDAPDITVKELFPIVLALQLWARQFTNQKVIMFCDNQAVVQIINKQSSRSPVVMSLVRLLVLTCLQCNVLFRAKHIPGYTNCMADCLSRGQLIKFRSLAPTADRHPTPVPNTLQRLLQLK